MNLIFPLLFLFVFAMMLFYSKKRVIDKAVFSSKFKKISYFILAFIYLFVILYFIDRYFAFLPKEIFYLASLASGIGFLIFVFTLFFELYLLYVRIFKPSIKQKNAIEFLLFTFMIFYISFGIINGQLDPKVTKHTITTDKLIKKDINIVFFSDLHIGGFVGSKYVQNVVDLIYSQTPDIVLIGGDLIDTKIEHITKELELLKEISSIYCTYFIVGNHEYFHVLQHIISSSESLGLKTLLNETIKIADLDIQLSGLYDYMGKRSAINAPDLKVLDIDKNLFSILISHQPKVINDDDFIAEEFDLILSGHTHCGQICPFGLLVLLDQPYRCGEYHLGKNLNLIISAGAGFWGPKMRIGSSYEIHKITISPNKMD